MDGFFRILEKTSSELICTRLYICSTISCNQKLYLLNLLLNSTLKKWSKSVLPRVDPKAEWGIQQPCSATASFWWPEIKAVEASRPASGGWSAAKATKWCQALLFNVSSRHHLLGRYRAISFRATFCALIWRVFSRLDFFSRHIWALIWRVFFWLDFSFWLITISRWKI